MMFNISIIMIMIMMIIIIIIITIFTEDITKLPLSLLGWSSIYITIIYYAELKPEA